MSLATLLGWSRKSKGDEGGNERPGTGGARGRSSAAAATPRGDCYARLLDRDAGTGEARLSAAWKSLEERMALVPAGTVALERTHGDARDPAEPFATAPAGNVVQVAALYIDRCAVSNAEFARFIEDGGYDAMELWPEEIWPNVVQFVDQTGVTGPRFWSHGRPPRGRDDHPVVGVSWYEASAYAAWAGKRLPSSAEWQRAGTWAAGPDGLEAPRYPWGNAFDPARANTAAAGPGTTAPVDEYYKGCTPNGIYQLTGNVWEWVADRYQGPAVRDGFHVFLDRPMAEIRGGAFDTYFESQAGCRFRTGQPMLQRASNIGFRCVVSSDRLRQPSDGVLR